jgi:nitroimidazol reductase NimA-like FMN-containing flavoprotein (pyridoxamine 5'-phosphate oxidase superfamily)
VIIYGATQSLFQKSGYSHDMPPVKVTFNQVEREFRKMSFGILGTLSRKGQSHSVGVLYGVSPPNKPLALYVMTGRDTRKVRNIANNPNVSFAISS